MFAFPADSIICSSCFMQHAAIRQFSQLIRAPELINSIIVKKETPIEEKWNDRSLIHRFFCHNGHQAFSFVLKDVVIYPGKANLPMMTGTSAPVAEGKLLATP